LIWRRIKPGRLRASRGRRIKEEGVKGEWEALKVPSGIAKVVENVFEVTEDVDGRGIEALEGLKELLSLFWSFLRKIMRRRSKEGVSLRGRWC